MASEGVISTGTCVAVSSVAPATDDAAGYAALTWTENWQEVTSYGNVGPSAALTEYKTVCNGEVHRRPASKDYGTMSISAANVETDENQILLQNAIDATPVSPVYVRLTLSTGAIRYFKAFPGSLQDEIGDADSMLMTTVELAVDGGWVRVAAA